MSKLSLFKGRKLLSSEIPLTERQLLNEKQVLRYPTMTEEEEFIRCLRCNTRHLKKTVWIGKETKGYYYCPTCIQLGRVQSNQSFYVVPDTQERVKRTVLFAWQGQLSDNQALVSQKVVATIADNRQLLIHAVTGAGKTEMLFAGILYALEQGFRVCLASPRTDVCLELYPRLANVFPEISISLLYGKQPAAYHYSQLVICTTHQLLRFYRAFDVLIIDEVDAFPYVNNQMLMYGVEQAQRKRSSRLYLSATPTIELYQDVAEGKLTYHHLPVRFHGKPLPVPKGVWVWQWEQQLAKGKLPRRLNQLIHHQLNRKRRTLIFCPSIKLVEILRRVLELYYPENQIAAVHARDQERYEKVEEMRKETYELLLTTTILERGVTFEAIDVIIIGSNHPIFNEAALIQIAGRVGRSKKDHSGSIWLIHDGWSQSMKSCCQTIRQSNAQAKKEGMLLT